MKKQFIKLQYEKRGHDKKDYIKLKFPNIDDLEEKVIHDYCDLMGYKFEFNREKRKARILYEKDNKSKVVYLQKIKGRLFTIYGNRMEDLSSIIELAYQLLSVYNNPETDRVTKTKRQPKEYYSIATKVNNLFGFVRMFTGIEELECI